MKNLKPCTILALMVCLVACKKNDNLIVRDIPNTMDLEVEAAFYVNTRSIDLQKKLPDYLVTMGLSQPSLDIAKATLGRIVFYDKSLSKDGTISCASCHKQRFGFSDNVAFSNGIDGQLTTRNSMALTNVASFAAHYTDIHGTRPALLWDGRAATIINQAPLAFANPHEMGLSMVEVVQKAKELPYYRYFMTQAFGDNIVTETRLLEGLQEFVNAIGGADSKLDRALEKVNGDLFGTYAQITVRTKIAEQYYGPVDTVGIDTTLLPLMDFSASELRGRTIFAQKCTKCHSPIRTLQEEFMACNGLDVNYLDKGLGGITGRQEDNGVFKSPSLRNIALTAPYMHDGRFKYLWEVVDFYSTGIQPNTNLDPLLRDANGQPMRMNFTVQEKKDLIAFMNTMPSYEMVNNTSFSNPFQ